MTRTSNGETTTCTYDTLGQLRSVALPSHRIDNVIDPTGRRIGKQVDGQLTKGFVYDAQGRVLAELDGAGNLVSQFAYGTHRNVPDLMLQSSKTYRLVSDYLGSVRLVVDSGTGDVAQQLDYDVWGNVTSDSNPGFQPFAFAGGLYDADTGLVRFGARDYDPMVGRWTSKDPILFGGGQANIYVYVGNDPVNLVDPFGTCGGFLGFTVGGSWWPAGSEIGLGLFWDRDAQSGDLRIGTYSRIGWNAGVGNGWGMGVEVGNFDSYQGFSGYGAGYLASTPLIGASWSHSELDGSGKDRTASLVYGVGGGYRAGGEFTFTQTGGVRWSNRDDDWLPF